MIRCQPSMLTAWTMCETMSTSPRESWPAVAASTAKLWAATRTKNLSTNVWHALKNFRSTFRCVWGAGQISTNLCYLCAGPQPPRIWKKSMRLTWIEILANHKLSLKLKKASNRYIQKTRRSRNQFSSWIKTWLKSRGSWTNWSLSRSLAWKSWRSLIKFCFSASLTVSTS